MTTRTIRSKVHGYRGVLWLALMLRLLTIAPCANAQARYEIKPEQCLGGNLDAPIHLEVFSDFQCTHCSEFFLNTIPPVLKDYCSLNRVCVVYHEFPLPSNTYSRRAAQYSKAAQKLGREQWRAVMRTLYENQSQWSFSGLIGPFVEKTLSSDDYSRLKALLREGAIDKEIDAEVALGEKRNVTITPTIFVRARGREQKISGILPYPVLKSFFDSVAK